MFTTNFQFDLNRSKRFQNAEFYNIFQWFQQGWMIFTPESNFLLTIQHFFNHY